MTALLLILAAVLVAVLDLAVVLGFRAQARRNGGWR